VEKKFKILRFIGTVYKVLGIITAVLTVLGAVGICLTSVLGGAIFDQIQGELGNLGPMGVMGGAAGGAIIGGFLLVWGTIIALLLLAAGEGIYLLLASRRIREQLLTVCSNSARPNTRPRRILPSHTRHSHSLTAEHTPRKTALALMRAPSFFLRFLPRRGRNEVARSTTPHAE